MTETFFSKVFWRSLFYDIPLEDNVPFPPADFGFSVSSFFSFLGPPFHTFCFTLGPSAHEERDPSRNSLAKPFFFFSASRDLLSRPCFDLTLAFSVAGNFHPLGVGWSESFCYFPFRTFPPFGFVFSKLETFFFYLISPSSLKMITPLIVLFRHPSERVCVRRLLGSWNVPFLERPESIHRDEPYPFSEVSCVALYYLLTA